MHGEFYIYTRSGNGRDVFPDNSYADYRVELPHSKPLDGKWVCGLVECVLPRTPRVPVYVCCDSIVESSAGDYVLPVLRQVHTKTSQFAHVLYVPIKETSLHTLRLYLRTASNQDVSPSRSAVTSILLHVKRYDDQTTVRARTVDDDSRGRI